MRYFILSLLFSIFANLYSQKAFIDPVLLSKDKNEKQSVVIFLKDQADISPVKFIKGKEAKAKFVYDKLIQTSSNTQKNIIAFLDQNQISYRSYYIVNMIACKMDLEMIRLVSSFEEVSQVIEDSHFVKDRIEESRLGNRAIEWGITKIKADSVWLLGHKGQNVVIGGQDTGYDWDHPALKFKYKGYDSLSMSVNHNYNWHDAIHTWVPIGNDTINPCGWNSPFPCDDNNHGTHTMGTMVGDDYAGNQIGVAPSAKWIGCRNMDEGDGVLSTYVECFEWFLAPYPVGGNSSMGDPAKAPHVINNSWGCPTSEGCNSTNFAVMELALNNLRNAGTVIVVSAGNSGSGCNTVKDPPAFFQNAFSIGASNSSDAIAGFSSRGVVTVDGSNRLKPNVVAPGVAVRSCIPGTGYASFQGTSMAGPHVAGLVALIISANPSLAGEVDEIESIIQETSKRFTSTQTCTVPGSNIPNAVFGYGRIDALAAVQRAKKEIHVPIIKVDQFGYKTNGQKIAILSDPKTGFNADESYTPPSSIYVRNAVTQSTVFTGTASLWNTGLTHDQSGDKVWWFDFSAFATPGVYYVTDNNIRSEDFVIGENVYENALKAAFKTFYYQRCHQAKVLPYCLTGYADAQCHHQDVTCKLYNNPIPANDKDLSGGWHDAGDYNKYVNFTFSTLSDLLNAYEYNPHAWNDAFNIPESGNNIPDLLDEIKYELDWLIKMQDADGGVYSVVGTLNYQTASPPSADAATRYYGPKTTSASLSTAAIFAYASRQFKKINLPSMQTYATTLKNKAISAWTWANNNPNMTFYNQSVTLAAGEQEVSTYERDMRKLAAAIYLFDITSDNTYKTYVETNYSNAHMLQWIFVYPFENPIQQSLLFYAHIKGISSGVKTAIINAYKSSMDGSADNYPSFINNTDAYRAFLKTDNYTWGSNGTKANMGNLYLSYQHFNLDTLKESNLNKILSAYTSYFHGINPMGISYLTNMKNFGSANSINSIYHSWFKDNSNLWDDAKISTYGPAPGFIPGGPNPSYAVDACCALPLSNPSSCASNPLCTQLSPPYGQPTQKSFRSINGGWPQNSWTITENSIYVQAAYLCLLSAHLNIVPSNPTLTTSSMISKDVHVVNSNNGIVLRSPSNLYFRVKVDNSGLLIKESISPVIQSSKLQNNSLFLTSKTSGVILKSPNNSLWRLRIDNGGNVITESIATLPGILVSQMSGDFIIEHSSYGLILSDFQNLEFKVTVDDTGNLFSTPVPN